MGYHPALKNLLIAPAAAPKKTVKFQRTFAACLVKQSNSPVVKQSLPTDRSLPDYLTI